MTKLNQIIAAEKGVKAQAARDITAAYHLLQKPEPLRGISRTYQPKDDDGDQLPSESTLVQVKVESVIQEVAASLINLFDLTFTKEDANTKAVADVVVDGEVLIANAPVTYLLFLEKQLTDLSTFISKLPKLDPSETWHYDTNIGAHVTEPTRTTRTKKVPRNHVKAEATDKHPAQVEIFHEDILVGYWTTVKSSGALPADTVSEFTRRVEKLKLAVKFAREEANGLVVEQQNVAANVFNYLFR